jgi:hypothetical protein
MIKSALWVLGGAVVGVVIMVVMIKLFKPESNKLESAVKLTPQPSQVFSFDPEKPPKDSLVGSILSFNGEVKWKGRVATEAAEINAPINIQQGEELETGEGGKVIVEFPQVLQLTMLEKSHINFAQTLPVNLVVVQSQGAVEYHNLGIKIFSVRVLHLLVEQGQGDMVVSINEDQPLVTVTVNKGAAKLAFNDKDNLTNVVELEAGERFIFNDEERTGSLR